MAAGSKLKKLIRELERTSEKLGKSHPIVIALKNEVDDEIEDTKTIWDMERQKLATDLESVEAEMIVVEKQIAIVNQKRAHQEQRVERGAASVKDSFSIESAVLDAERDMLKLKYRRQSTQNAMDWMLKFEEKYLKSNAVKPETPLL